MSTVEIRHIENITDVCAAAWDRMVGDDNPFMRHAFLAALESTGCVDNDCGWQPYHVVAEIDAAIVGAMPLYFKSHSYGEYVFDWAWADAYERAGMQYYPKLLCAVPFTPVAGERLLQTPAGAKADAAAAMVNAVKEFAREHGISSIHWLFTNQRDTETLRNSELLVRQGSQFHWRNKDFKDFDAYLDEFSSKRRKNIKRERRRVQEQGIEFDVLSDDALLQEHWDRFYRFYLSTIQSRGAIPYLKREFFDRLHETMPAAVVLTLARVDDRYIAGALNLKGTNTLYGRYWGADGLFENLHFETCYYQGIDYCIRHGLKRFEAGAQGEHKLNRGLMPTPTWSAHWISHPKFSAAIEDFLDRERPEVERYQKILTAHSPFKRA